MKKIYDNDDMKVGTWSSVVERWLLWVERYLVPILLALLLLPPLASMVWVLNKPDMIDVMSRNFYFFNYFIGYETGFGGRKLIGTVCHCLWGDSMNLSKILIIDLVVNAVMLFMLGWFLLRVLPRIDRRSLPMAVILALYMVSPLSLWRYVQGHRPMSVIYMETYQFILVLAWLLLYLRHRGSVVYWIATITTPLLGLMVHHTFLCTFMPLYVALAIVDLRDDPTRGKWLMYGTTGLLSGMLFMALWKFGTMNVGVDELYSRIEGGGVKAYKESLSVLYYISNFENRQLAFASQATAKLLDFVFILLFMSPLVMILCYPWLHGRRLKDVLLSPAVIITVFTLPIFVMATDYGRWWTCYLFCLLAALCVRRDDANVARGIEHMRHWGRKYWYVVLLLFVWMAELHGGDFVGVVEAVRLRQVVLSL